MATWQHGFYARLTDLTTKPVINCAQRACLHCRSDGILCNQTRACALYFYQSLAEACRSPLFPSSTKRLNASAQVHAHTCTCTNYLVNNHYSVVRTFLLYRNTWHVPSLHKDCTTAGSSPTCWTLLVPWHAPIPLTLTLKAQPL
jgi:hypothetical protein